MKKNGFLAFLGIVAAAAALAGAAFGVWKFLQRKKTCDCCQDDLPDFSEDFDTDVDGEGCDCCGDAEDDIDLNIHVDEEEKGE